MKTTVTMKDYKLDLSNYITSNTLFMTYVRFSSNVRILSKGNLDDFTITHNHALQS